MDLYLIRHAEAVALGEAGINDDALRPLTERGQQQSQQVAQALGRRDVQLDKLLTSPLVRAHQTAQTILKNWSGAAPELIVCEELVPESRPKDLARFLTQLAGERIGLVGHAPHINILAAWLIGTKQAQIDIAKAGIAHIPCDGPPAKGAGTLNWLVIPAWF